MREITAVRRQLRVAVGAAWITACALPAGAAVDESAPQHGEDEHADAASAVVNVVNQVRATHDLAVLIADPALHRAAQQHAQELARRRTLDHYSTDDQRRTPADRVTAACASWTRVGENLASLSTTRAQVAGRVTEMWLRSPGHRQQLLGQYTHTGVGVARSDDGLWYVVQLYTVPLGRR